MKNVNESGRSMVEMLGVLAIIGVLSIGGIAGYSLAMNRYRANEILNAVSLVAIEATSKNGGVGGNSNLDDIGGVDALSIPALQSGSNAIYATASGIVTVKVNKDYAKVANLVKSLSGGRVSSNSETDVSCSTDAKCKVVINMQAKI